MPVDPGVGFEQRLDRLWTGWYGVTSPAAVDRDEPRALAVLRAVARGRKVFGFQNELLEPRPADRHGVVAVVVENQNLWTVGYLPDGTDDPDGVMYDGHTGELFALVESGLVELLYRTAVIEAIFSGPWRSTLGEVPGSVIDALLGPDSVAPVLTDGKNYGLPAIWDLGNVLVMGFGADDEWTLYAGTADLAAFDSSPLGTSCEWS